MEQAGQPLAGLCDRAFLVTGGASGIGRATAGRLVAAGASVLLFDRDTDRLDAVCAELQPPGDVAIRVIAVPGDVRDPDALGSAVERLLESFGGLHGAATCAGIFDPGDMVAIDQVDLDVFDTVLAVNLRGTLCTMQAVLPHLEPGGAIVTVASTAGLRGHGFGPAYTASKGGVIALTRLAALQYGPKGIRVNCICPGATAGEGMGAAFADPGSAAALGARVPLRRVGQAADVGATIAALLSDETSYVSGQILAVDGGATAR